MADKSHIQGQDEKMPVRQSIFLWVVGAIFSWVLIVVTVYSALRFSDTPSDAPASQLEATVDDEAERLNEIAPAAGGDTYPVPEDGTLGDDIAPELDDLEAETEAEKSEAKQKKPPQN